MKKLLTLALALAVLAVLTGPAVAQEERKGLVGGGIPCPIPMNVHLTAPPAIAATPIPADFPATTTPVEPNFGGTTKNRHFRHTFSWQQAGKCCQCLRGGTLSFQYKALSGGPAGSSSSANDGVVIYKNASPLLSQPLYSGAVTTGQTGTKTIPLTCAMLTNNRLSFLVQDDTSVTKATLDGVVFCCVNP